MQKNELKKEIDTLIDSIKKQADRMNAENNFSKVELEVFHHKIQKLYEKSILIHHLPAEEEKAPSHSPSRFISSEPAPKPVETPEPIPVTASKEIPVSPAATIADSKPAADLFGNTPAPPSIPAPKARHEKESKLPRKSIADLKVAISINDKFRFINELFDGNAVEFNIALSQINNSKGFEDADIYMANIKDIYKWKDDSEAVLLFMDLVERRFL